MVKTLIYSRYDHAIIDEVRDGCKGVEGLSLSWSRDLKSFRRDLGVSLAGETLVLFIVGDEADMAFLESVQSGFMDIKLMIYFTCPENGLRDRAYKCYPRLISGPADEDRLMTAAVRRTVSQMLQLQSVQPYT